MTILVKGANAPLDGNAFEVSVRWKRGNPTLDEVDVSAFILGPSGKVAGDDDMIFYGQREAPAQGLRLVETNRVLSGDLVEALFQVDLARLPATAEKVAITATIPDAVTKRLSFDDVAVLDIAVVQGGQRQVTFDVPVAGMTEAALILAELYKRNGQWKIRAIAQGFNGGLKPLAEGFGVKIEDGPVTATPPSPATPPPPPARPSSPVSLSKVTLTKAAPAVSLKKTGSSFGEIRINLNWNQKQGGGGGGGFFGFGGSKNVDLDLACLYELKNGDKGVVQALGDSFGNFDRAPYIRLSADDRTGANAEGEWLRVNGAKWSEIQRILVFTFIYEGVTNWTQTDGVVTLYVPDNAPVEVRLDGGESRQRNCAIVLLENEGGEIRVRREVLYFENTRSVDAHYGWGMRWVSGRK